MGRRLGYVVLLMSAGVFLAAGPAAALWNPIAHRFDKPPPQGWVEKRLPASTTAVPSKPPRALMARALVLSDIPSPAVTGLPYTFTLRAVTRDGRTATGYRGTVEFMSTDPAAEVDVSPYTFVPEDAGQHLFTVTFHTPGRHWLHVEDTVNLSLSTEQGRIVVTDDPVALVAAAVEAASRAEAMANAIAALGSTVSASSPISTTSTTPTTSTTLSTGSTTSTTSSNGSTTSMTSTSTTTGSGSTTSSTPPSSTTSSNPADSTADAGSPAASTSSASSSSSASTTSTSLAVLQERAEVSNPQPQPGQDVQVTGGTTHPFAPDQELKVELRSDPVDLAPATSLPNGLYIAEVTIPEDTLPGEHEIVVSGLAADGIQRVESIATVEVVGSGSSSSAGATGASESSGGSGASDSSGGESVSGSSSAGGSSISRTGWSPRLLKLALALAFAGLVLVRSGKPDVRSATGRGCL